MVLRPPWLDFRSGTRENHDFGETSRKSCKIMNIPISHMISMFLSPQGRTGPHKPYGIPKDFYTFQPLASTRAKKRDLRGIP